MPDYDGPAELRLLLAAEDPDRVARMRERGMRQIVGISTGVAVQVTATDAGWDVRASPRDDEERWALQMFSSPLQLVFPDGSTFDVDIDDGDGHTWRLTETTSSQETTE